MDASDLLLEHWIRQVKELFPNLHSYQQETIAVCVQGIVQSGNAVMQRVAETLWEHLSSETKLVSYERRKLRRRYQEWQQGKQVVKKEGEQWYGEVLLWKEHQFVGWLSACWEPGDEDAWLLLSDRPASHQRVSEYARRMRVEATFQDQKSRGCFIECSRFTNREHLHRWLFVVYVEVLAPARFEPTPTKPRISFR